ncbi:MULTISPECIES: DNA repair protein RecO [unclassified Virgibacillus]|uniref:DNA repair protein RecO n=1 Tax=unclassified Virgibacillus TaxID=2620237 RepID=UPI0024DE0EF8|nr:DNA repair protein RecO [Virgibacillus sp. LDC-1]
MLEKIDGIIIKTSDYGETHKIVTIFSEKIGKFSAIARGAKKPKSRMAALTQPFIHGQFFVYLSKGLSTIQQGDIIHSFRSIREDIIKTAYAAFLLELTDKLVEDKKPNIYLYQQLFATMKWIENHDDYQIPVMMYELKSYQIGGFLPTVDKCVQCGSKQSPFAFSVLEGGFLCKGCMSKDIQAVSLSNSVARLFQLFAQVGLERIGNISMKEENIQLIRQILDQYYDQYGGYALKSKRFLNQLDRLS